MDCSKTGRLIFALRKENGMTQKQLGEALNISDRAISKWERGMGCPDVSLLNELSKLLKINIEKILLGELDTSYSEAISMKKIKFYLCPNCGNVITATSEGEISCCGRKLSSLVQKPAEEEHNITVEMVEDDYYITFSHPMTKNHYISFVACASYDRVLTVKLYPEQSGEVRFAAMPRGKIYFACNQHGLWVADVKKP